MRGIPGSCAFATVCAMTLLVAGSTWAQNMEVRPGSLDFGDVVVGGSAIATLEFESMGGSAVWAYVMGLKDSTDASAEVYSPIPNLGIDGRFTESEWELGAFSLDPADAAWRLLPACSDGGSIYGCDPDDDLFIGYASGFLPREMPDGEIFTIHVTFTPPSPGDYRAYFYLHSNDSVGPPGMQAHILMEGTGVADATIPEPASLLLLGTGVGLIGFTAWRNRQLARTR